MVTNWRQRQKQELRQQLYEAAVQLFEREGYEQTTVQQITAAVGVAKGTFFNHFPTKEHVVAYWYDSITVQALAAARAVDYASAVEAVCGLFTEMTTRATASPELMMAKSSHSSHPLLLAAEQAQVDEMNAYLLDHCRRGKTTGELAADLDEAFFVGVLGAILTGTSRAWVMSRPRFSFPDLICERVRFVFRAAQQGEPT